MADNFEANPGAGGRIFKSVELPGAVHLPNSLVVDETGTAWDAGNPFPVTGPLTDAELRASPVSVEMASAPLPAGAAKDFTLEALLVNLARLIDNVGVLSPDIAGRLRVVVDTGSSISTITTVTGVTTVTTVGTVTNQAQMGGIATNQQIPALTMMAEGDLRRNIVIS